MAKHDLEKIYRSIKARVTRSQHNSVRYFVTELAAERAKSFRDNPTEENLLLFKEAEIAFSEYTNRLIFLWRDFEDALLTGDYCVKYSHIKNSPSRYDPPKGFIYLAISNSKPGQIRIGATTTTLNQRLSSFKLKYGYTHFVAIYSKSVEFPARIERAVQEKLRKYRVSSITSGDSNEWYELNVAYCKRVVTESIKNMSFSTQN
jgi:T5orf172 domain